MGPEKDVEGGGSTATVTKQDYLHIAVIFASGDEAIFASKCE